MWEEVTFIWPVHFGPRYFFNHLSRYWEFGFGALTFLFINQLSAKNWVQTILPTLKVLALFIIVLFFIYIKESRVTTIELLLFTLLNCILLLPGTKYTPSNNLLENTSIRYIGRLAYSLYLFHFPLLKLTEYYFDITSTVNVPVIVVYCIVLSVMAYLNYHYIEQKFILQ